VHGDDAVEQVAGMLGYPVRGHRVQREGAGTPLIGRGQQRTAGGPLVRGQSYLQACGESVVTGSALSRCPAAGRVAILVTMIRWVSSQRATVQGPRSTGSAIASTTGRAVRDDGGDAVPDGDITGGEVGDPSCGALNGTTDPSAP